MSDNTARARVAFSFKGESYKLDSVINLDRCLDERGCGARFSPAEPPRI